MEAAAKHLTPVTLELGGMGNVFFFLIRFRIEETSLQQANPPSSSTLNAISRRLGNDYSGEKLRMQVKLALRLTMFSFLETSKMSLSRNLRNGITFPVVNTITV